MLPMGGPARPWSAVVGPAPLLAGPELPLLGPAPVGPLWQARSAWPAGTAPSPTRRRRAAQRPGGADALVAVFVPPIATPGNAYARALREGGRRDPVGGQAGRGGVLRGRGCACRARRSRRGRHARPRVGAELRQPRARRRGAGPREPLRGLARGARRRLHPAAGIDSDAARGLVARVGADAATATPPARSSTAWRAAPQSKPTARAHPPQRQVTQPPPAPQQTATQWSAASRSSAGGCWTTRRRRSCWRATASRSSSRGGWRTRRPPWPPPRSWAIPSR